MPRMINQDAATSRRRPGPSAGGSGRRTPQPQMTSNNNNMQYPNSTVGGGAAGGGVFANGTSGANTAGPARSGGYGLGLSGGNAAVTAAGGGGGRGIVDPMTEVHPQEQRQQQQSNLMVQNVLQKYQQQTTSQQLLEQQQHPNNGRSQEGPPSVVEFGRGGTDGSTDGCYDNLEFTQLTQDSTFSLLGRMDDVNANAEDNTGTCSQEASGPTNCQEQEQDLQVRVAPKMPAREDDDSSATMAANNNSQQGHGKNGEENEDENEDDEEDEDEDELSIDLLAPSPPSKRSVPQQMPNDSSDGRREAVIAATTPMPKKSKKGKKPAAAGQTSTALEAPGSASSQSTAISPATQTLNALSQMDAVGGGDLMMMYGKSVGGDDDDDGSATTDDEATCNDDAVPVNSKKKNDDGNAKSTAKGRSDKPTSKPTKKKAAPASSALPPTKEKSSLTPTKKKKSAAPKQTKKKVSGSTKSAGRGTGWMSSTSAFAKGGSGTSRSDPAGDGKKKGRQAPPKNRTKKRSNPQTGGAVFRTDHGTHIDILITLSEEEGMLGFKVKPITGVNADIESMLSKIDDSDRPCVVGAIKEGSQADRAGLKAKDALFHVSKDKPGSAGRYATANDAKEWAKQGASRPVIFIARRFNTEMKDGPGLDLLGFCGTITTEEEVADGTGRKNEPPRSKSDNNSYEESKKATSKAPRRNADEDEDDIGQIQSSPESSKEEEKVYTFQGKTYKTYSDMVKAKRARNMGILQDIGLIDVAATIREGAAAKSKAKSDKKRKAKSSDENPANQARRKSSRLEKNDEDSDDDDDDGGLLPDCNACKKESADDNESTCSGSNALEHHPLCPERSDHVSSGARAQLKQIRRTLKRCNCSACKWYLKHRKEGTHNGRAHNPLCEKSRLYNPGPSGNAKGTSQRLVVTFCRRCKGERGDGAPLEHHVFCPSHPDFERFGAKAKLERIQRNAIENGCEACSFRLENGRPDKSLAHGSKCDYSTEEKTNEGASENIVAGAQSGSSVPDANSRESIIEGLRREGAKEDCKRCKEELRTGKKASGAHSKSCPMRNDQGLRRIGAAAGCLKCVNELRTERKDKTAHSQLCPLSKQYGSKVATLSQGADAGCQKCADEIRTGTKQPKKVHSRSCPFSKYYMSKTNQADSSATTAAEIFLDIRDSPNKKLPATKTIDTDSLSFHPISEINEAEAEAEAVLLGNESIDGVAKARITPSPKPQHDPNRGTHQKAAVAFPETMEESDFEDDETSTLWEQCGNPWGDIGLTEEDHVIITPCSGLNPTEVTIASLSLPTFNANPFDESSPYRQTHQLPEVGVRALKLKRDVMSMQPWGLSFKRHEFGGACLVTSVDPISPAAAAEDIGGGRNDRGLQVNDMVLMVNSKSVGDMIEDDLEVELEISGEELTLVISRYNGGPMKGQAHNDESEKVAETWHELDKGAFDWQDLGPGSMCTQRRSVTTRIAPQSSATDRCFDSFPRDAGGGTGPDTDVSKFRRETFRTQPNHDDHPSAHPHKETATSTNDEQAESSTKSKAHTNDPILPKEKSEHQAESEKDGASSRSDIFPVGADGGTREYSSQADKIVTSRASPQGNGEESTDGGAEAAPGLSLSRIMADFSISTSMKNRKHEEGGHKGPSDAKGTPSTTSTDIRAREVIAEWNAEGDDGDDPELGCICGDIHEEPEPVFWLHCDTCESWYNNSVRCLGFDQETADKLKEWTCASCGGNQAIPHEGTKKKVSDEDKDKYDDEDDDDILPIGSRVNVLVGKDLWKGTIHRVGRKHGNVYYRVNLDGNRKATLTTVFSHDIHSLITEPEVDKQDEHIDRSDSPLKKDADDAGISKRPSDVAFGNDSDSESEQGPLPKKKKVGKTEPPANLSKPKKTSVGDEDSEESEFAITESEALFLSGNIGDQKVHSDLGAGSGEQCTTSDDEESQSMKVDSGGSTFESSNDKSPIAKAQSKPKSSNKPIFETIEEIDEDIIEFKDCGKIERRRIDWDHTPISVGSLVRVADRSAGTNSGNKLGGVAKVMGGRGSRSENNLVYDLRYVIGANREFDVSWRYVVLNSDFDSAGSGDGGDNGRSSSRRSRKSKRPFTEPSVSEKGSEFPIKVKVKLSALPLDKGGIHGYYI